MAIKQVKVLRNMQEIKKSLITNFSLLDFAGYNASLFDQKCWPKSSASFNLPPVFYLTDPIQIKGEWMHELAVPMFKAN
jgi:hypothetical protein